MLVYLRQLAQCRQGVGAFDAVESEKAPPHAADIANVKFDADSSHLTTQRICHTNTKHTQVGKIFANTQLAESSSMHPGLLFKYKQNESFLYSEFERSIGSTWQHVCQHRDHSRDLNDATQFTKCQQNFFGTQARQLAQENVPQA